MNRRGFGVALLVLTLIIGFEAGVLAERKIFSANDEIADLERPFRGPRGGFERGPARFASRLSARLDLSDEQQRAVEALLIANNEDLEGLLAQLRPEITARVDVVTEEIHALLDPEQIEAFEAMLRDDQDRFRQRIESGFVGRGPAGRRGR